MPVSVLSPSRGEKARSQSAPTGQPSTPNQRLVWLPVAGALDALAVLRHGARRTELRCVHVYSVLQDGSAWRVRLPNGSRWYTVTAVDLAYTWREAQPDIQRLAEETRRARQALEAQGLEVVSVLGRQP